MTAEQLLLEKWRKLSPEKKSEVIDFVTFLEFREYPPMPSEPTLQVSNTLGARLQQIRERIVVSETPLLTEAEIEKEVAERRGGY